MAYKARFFVITDLDERKCRPQGDSILMPSLEGEDIPVPIPGNAVRLDILDGNDKIARRIYFKGEEQTADQIAALGGNVAHAVYVDELKMMFPASAGDQILKGRSFVTIQKPEADESELDEDFEDAVKPKAAKAEPKLDRRDFPMIEPGLQEIPRTPEREKPRYIPGITDKKFH